MAAAAIAAKTTTVRVAVIELLALLGGVRAVPAGQVEKEQQDKSISLAVVEATAVCSSSSSSSSSSRSTSGGGSRKTE